MEPRTPSRRFGTVISVNSPVPSSSKKKARLRSSKKPKFPEETIIFEKENEYAVDFEPGSIGLTLDECIVKDVKEPASLSVKIGDELLTVNGTPVSHAMHLLQDSQLHRRLVFRRAKYPSKTPSPRKQSRSVLTPPATISFLRQPTDSRTKDTSELELMRQELVKYVDENKQLKRSQNAILALEYKLRVQSLESELGSTKSKYRERLEASQSQLDTQRHELTSEYQTNLASKDQELQALQQQLRDTQHALQTKISSKESELQTAHSVLEAHQQRRVTIEHELKSQILCKDEDLNELKETVDDLQQQLVEAFKSKTELQMEMSAKISSKEKELTALTDQLNDLQTQLAETRKASTVASLAKNSELNEIREQNTQLESQVSRATNEYRALRRALAELEASHRQLQQSHALLKTESENNPRDIELGQLRAKYESLNAQHDELLERYALSHEEKEYLSSDLAALSVELQSTMQSLESRDTQLETLKTELSRVLASSKELQNQYKSTQKELEHQKVVTETLQTDFSNTRINLEEQIGRLKADNQCLRDEKDKMVELTETNRVQHQKTREERSHERIRAEQLTLQLAEVEADLQASYEQVQLKNIEVQNLEQKLISAKSRNDKLLSELRSSENSLDSYSRLVETSGTQISALKETLLAKEAAFARELDSADAALSQCHSHLAGLQQENEILKAQLEQLSNAQSSAKETEGNLSREVRRLKSEIADLQSSSNTVTSELSHQIKLLEMDMEDRQLLLDQKTKDYQVTKDELKTALQQNEQLIMDLGRAESSLETASKQVKTLEKQLTEQANREAKVRTDLQETMESKIADISTAATTKLQEARNEIVDLVTELKSTSRKKADLDKESAKLKSELADATKEQHRLRSLVDARDAELSEFSDSLNTCQVELQNTEMTLSSVTQELAATKNARDEAESQLSRLSTKISKLFADLSKTKDALTAQIQQQQQEIDTLAADKSRLEHSKRGLDSKLAETELLVLDSRDELLLSKEALHDQKIQFEQTIQSLESRVLELESEKSKYSELSSRLRDECEAMKNEIKKLKCKLEATGLEMSSLSAQLQLSEKTLSKTVERFEAQIAIERKAGQESMEKLRSSLSEKDDELRKATTAARRLDEQIRLLQYEVDLKKKRQVQFANDKDSVMQEYGQCRSDLQAAKAEVARLERSVEVYRKEIDFHTAKAATIAADHESVLKEIREQHSSEVHTFRRTILHLEHSLHTTGEEKKSTLNQLKSVEESLVKIRSERDQVIKEVSGLKIEFRKAQDRIEELQFEADNQSVNDSDSLGSPFKNFSKYDLRSTCLELQHDLKESKARTEEASEDAARRSEHVSALAFDLSSMSKEIESLVNSNGLLESSLKDSMSKQKVLEEEKSVLEKQIERLEQKEQSLQREISALRETNVSLSTDLHTLQSKSKSENGYVLLQRKALEDEASQLKSQLADLRQQRELENQDKTDTKEQLLSLKEQLRLSQEESVVLQAVVVELKGKLKLATGDNAKVQSDLQDKVSKVEQQLVESEDRCQQLRETVAALQADVEEKSRTIRESEKNQNQLSESLEKERQEALNAHLSREEVVSKLKEASRVVASQSDTIKSLEEQVRQAEHAASRASETALKLEGQLETAENTGPTYTLTPLKKVQELESKCCMLEAERSSDVAEANTLRDELREARRTNTELKRTNTTIQSRVTNLKKALETTEKNLLEARDSRDKAVNSCKRLEMELESKTMELERNKAQIQVLTAATARMKAESLLERGTAGRESNGTDTESSKEPNQDRIPVAALERALRENLFSPNTVRTAATEHFDVDQLKAVVRSLEAQIDVLLDDLDKANSKLKEKDQVYAELENLVALHESEREKLTRKLAEVENQLKRETLSRVGLQQQLARAHGSGRRRSGVDSDCSLATKRAAGRLLLHAIEQRELAAKSVAFRQWACQTSAVCAVAKQGRAAAELAKQLDMTREKLVILKKQIKKTRRAPPLSRIAESAESSP